jgi:integrase
MGGVSKASVSIRAASIRLRFTHEGVRHQPTLMLNGEPMKPTTSNLNYAKKLSIGVTERIRHGTFSMVETFPASGSGNTLTVGGQLDLWLKTETIEGSTRDGYASIITFWKGAIGTKPLRSLKHSDILQPLADRPDLSGKTVNNRMSVLRKALQLAVLDNILTSNPAAAVKSSKWQRKPPDPFSADEAERVIEGATEPQVRNFLQFKFFSGLRPGEAFGLRWQNVDLTKSSSTGPHIVVCESVVGGKHKVKTKTKQIRTVLLNSRALEALKAQKAHTFIEGDFVFHDPRDNKRWGGEPKFRWYWTPLLKRLGIRHRPPYNTRHSYAARMLMAGMVPAFAARQMGHGVQIFLTTYAKWIEGLGDKSEMAKLEIPHAGPVLVPDEASS